MTTPTPPTTDLDLTAIRERVDAATPGPWTADPGDATVDGPDGIPVVLVPHRDDDHAQAVTDAEFLAAARADVPTLLAEVERLKWELGRWTSGQRWLRLPVVTAVPDGLHTAAALARSIGTEGGEEHDALLARAAQTMKALHDAASWLIADRDAMRAVVEAAKAWRAAQSDMFTDVDRSGGVRSAVLYAAAEDTWDYTIGLIGAVDALPTPTEAP